MKKPKTSEKYKWKVTVTVRKTDTDKAKPISPSKIDLNTVEGFETYTYEFLLSRIVTDEP